MMDLKVIEAENSNTGEVAIPLDDGSVMPVNLLFVPQNDLGPVVYTFPTTPQDGDRVEWINSSQLFSLNSMTLIPSDRPVGVVGENSTESIQVTEDGVTGGFIFRSVVDLWEPYMTGFMGFSQHLAPELVGVCKYPSVTAAVSTLKRVSAISSLPVDTRTNNVTVIIDIDTFALQDELTITKWFSANRLTLQLTRGGFVLPDGTITTAPTVNDIPGRFRLFKYDANTFVFTLM